jgi:hypothetical protein
MKRAQVLFLAILLFVLPSKTLSQEHVDSDSFFSYERLHLNQNAVNKMPSQGKTQTDLNRFAQVYTDGLYAVSTGDTRGAEKDFLEARQIWPEYFYADLLLANVYEDAGDYSKAARFYKSYLIKLRKFHAGDYRISEPLIRVFTSSPIEGYEQAAAVVEERLASHGIAIGGVRPATGLPGFLVPLFFLLIFGVIFAMVVRNMIPYFKMRHRMKNPPEGFWICPNCGTGNTLLNKVCEKCGRPHG